MRGWLVVILVSKAILHVSFARNLVPLWLVSLKEEFELWGRWCEERTERKGHAKPSHVHCPRFNYMLDQRVG
jgi:hypothetical protein